MKIDKEEKKYFILLAIVLLVFAFILSKYEATLNNLGVLAQFLLFNAGVYFIIFFLLKAVATKTSVAKIASLDLMLIFYAFDIIAPEYHVTISGELIPGAIFGLGSSDYAIGSLGQLMGIQGGIFGISWLWLFTYWITPLTLFIIAAYFTNVVRKL